MRQKERHAALLLSLSAGFTGLVLLGSRGLGRSRSTLLAALTATVGATAWTVAALLGLRGSRRNALSLSPAYQAYPKQYVARKGTPPVIDGDVYKDIWERIPWSEEFQEIRGPDAPPGTGPSQAQATRMKMLWDEEFLYIAAVMDLAQGDELVAKFTERNSPIFHTDSDFEVFVDPAGCCHGYKELELNALNTVWNLMLDRPYSDGGGERGGRVAKFGEPDYWEVRRQQTATRILRGALDSPSAPSRWCCEVALAHGDTLPWAPVWGPVPHVGASWRINFSRVEKGGHVNWVWSPQVVWSPKETRYVGQVNMHLPDAWGYVVFADEDGRLPHTLPSERRDPSWPARHAAICVYYASRAYCEANGECPSTFGALQDSGMLDGAFLGDGAAQILVQKDSLLGERTCAFTVQAVLDGWKATVNHQRLLRVEKIEA